MLKLAEIKELSPDEVTSQVKKSRLELVDLKMKFVSRQLEDVSQIKKKRKEIARLLTMQSQTFKESKVNEIEDEKSVKPKRAKKISLYNKTKSKAKGDSKKAEEKLCQRKY